MNVANTFIKYQKYEEALRCYRIIQELYPDNKRLYHLQVAQIYQYMNQDEEMIKEYLELLKKDPSKQPTVLFYIEKYLGNDGIQSEKNYNIVRNIL